MNYREANLILDLCKSGQPVPSEVVDEALYMTGDGPIICDVPSPVLEGFVQAMREAGLI
jgi:hypothetical protein